MPKSSYCIVLLALLALAVASSATAQSRTYPDGHGGSVTFPQGDISFADEVVHYDTGSEKPVADASDPTQALGTPDYGQGGARGYVSLGCGGELVLKFTDNQLIDIPGPDLYVFEVGPAIEPTALAISDNNKDWVRIGRIEGGKAEIDIAPYVRADESFRYVKLVDLRAQCGGETPGADIDAVGAIGSLRQVALDSSVLFDTGKHQLKPQASAAITEALAGLDVQQLESVLVAGHTDSVGSAEANRLLSQNRAQSVASHLIEHAGVPASRITTAAYGEDAPVASNDTAEGRAKNRRVELSIRSLHGQEATDTARVDILGIWRDKNNRQTTLQQEGDRISGDYTRSGGRIEGVFTSETVFEGFWLKDTKPSRACDVEKDGTRHWGRLRLEFDSPDRNAFDARWASCDGSSWDGTWPQAERIL